MDGVSDNVNLMIINYSDSDQSYLKVDLEKFLSPMVSFITGEISAGRSVLVHCLAGAHRSITNTK